MTEFVEKNKDRKLLEDYFDDIAEFIVVLKPEFEGYC